MTINDNKDFYLTPEVVRDAVAKLTEDAPRFGEGIGTWPAFSQAPESMLTDINGAQVKVGVRIVWASKSPRDNPHPRAGMVTRVNVENGTVTARADLPAEDRGSSSTVPADRVMRVIGVPALGFDDIIRV